MSFESNAGSIYYELSCGVASDIGVDTDSNIFTGYYHLSVNDFILWGQPDNYPHPQTNYGSTPYYLECDRSSDVGLNINSNSGTRYYYSSAFNCVTFCDDIYINLEDPWLILTDVGDYLYDDGDLLTNTFIE